MRQFLITIFFSCVASFGTAQNAMTLDECLAMARSNNRSLQNAALAVQASREQERGAKANYLPQISANVMAFQAFDKLMKADGTLPEELAALGSINPAFSQLAGMPYSIHEMNRAYGVTVTAMEPLYAGGKIHAGVSLAKIQSMVSVLQERLQEKDVLQKVTENFWNVATQKYHLRTIETAEKQMAALYDQVSLFVKAGVTTRNALLKVKLHQQEIASKRLHLENGCKLLLLLLAQQTGSPSETFDIVLPPDSVVAEMPDAENWDIAVDQREELQLAFHNIKAQKLQVKMKRAGMLPTLAVGVAGYNMGLGGLSSPVKKYVPNSMTNGLALVSLSIPISPLWGTGRHAVKQQKYALRQAENDFADARESLSIDIQSAWLNLIEAHKQIEISRASVEEAEENYRMSQQQYRMGTETITDLLDAETLYRESADGLAGNIAAYHIRLADYYRKIGK